MRAVLNAADTGATESTAHMLRMVGWEVELPSDSLIAKLRGADVENVLTPADLERWGYDPPLWCRRTAEDFGDLFIDTKAHTNYEKLRSLGAKNILWLCLNGGDPQKRDDPRWYKPPCSILTHNQWYLGRCDAYVCFPPYMRRLHRWPITGKPLCFVHNVARWGYGDMLDEARACGVRLYGGGEGNDVLLSHADALYELQSALCLVLLKKGDTVGYAVVEAMSAGVPVLCTEHYIEECKLGELLIPGVTCLTFEPGKLDAALREINNTPKNYAIGDAGRYRYKKLAWSMLEYSELSAFLWRCVRG